MIFGRLFVGFGLTCGENGAEMVRAGKITSDERDIMILQQQRLAEALLREQEGGVAMGEA